MSGDAEKWAAFMAALKTKQQGAPLRGKRIVINWQPYCRMLRRHMRQAAAKSKTYQRDLS